MSTNVNRKLYPTDLSDEQWLAIKPYYIGMRTYKWDKRELTNAVLYLVDSGCKWRLLPHDFPPYPTVYSFFRRAKNSGLWDRILEVLVRMTRELAGRNPEPSYALIDSQSVKTVAASEERGYDGGKKTKGRKRHIVVDVMGNILSVVVHAANIHDTKSGVLAAKEACEKYPTIEKYCADAGYRGTFVSNMKDEFDMDVDISEKIKPHEWESLPWRWVVERTFAWLNNSRRLSKDYEILKDSAVAMVMISFIHILLKRL